MRDECDQKIEALQRQADGMRRELDRQARRAEEAERQRDALMQALSRCMQYVPDETVNCHGLKCRLQWCEACNGEEDAEAAVAEAQRDLNAARGAMDKKVAGYVEACGDPRHGSYFDVVFDGPPGPTPGRFVEVEDSQGRSTRVGEWIKREDGYWALRIKTPKEAG